MRRDEAVLAGGKEKNMLTFGLLTAAVSALCFLTAGGLMLWFFEGTAATLLLGGALLLLGIMLLAGLFWTLLRRRHR